ncbi:MAG TPA: arabinan endo-1,5-alpha-L-arabinosidase [Sphingomonas sp.]|nr:arabinan endo-1,5-alpha-L-arabinosidase [Sphingomonas sp.]
MFAIDRRRLLGGALITGGFAACPSFRRTPKPRPLNDRLSGDLAGIHDPVLIREGDVYHVFGSGGWNKKASPTWRVSRDLHHWTDNGEVFEEVPAWVREKVPGGTVFWAPDIARVDDQFRMYYAVSTGGSRRSVIGFATTPTLDRTSPRYGWTDRGMVIETHENSTFNAIDANFVADADGAHWLVFGSYWTGIKMIALDRETGKRLPGDTQIESLAYLPAPNDYGNNPIEGAFVFAHDGWYYLFASYQYCCRGASSNYSVSVGRSRSVHGPYLDNHGRPMMGGYGFEVLSDWPFGSSNFRGPGHCGLYHDGDRDLIVYHADDVKAGAPVLRIAELAWSRDDWPAAIV